PPARRCPRPRTDVERVSARAQPGSQPICFMIAYNASAMPGGDALGAATKAGVGIAIDACAHCGA
ncbi:MAG: hypothetical protein K2W80_13315, partial [Burkholderiales bacterium]|nr:hypothetical protein [Burkholderiales bacterium]